jgi:hypothetical protein
MPYEPFPIVDVAVAELHLDRNNFRIEDVLPSESAAITYLFSEHDIIGLARQILIEGYVDNELPLAIREDGRYVVLEGNRRTTALKALLNPAIAPRQGQADLEMLIRRHEIEAENIPTTVRVMVAPDRLSTRMLLARLHIGQSKSGWGRDAQARFVIAQLESGMSIADIRKELPGVKNAAGYVRQYYVRQILKEANFADPGLAAYASGSKLKMTSFEYAYGNPDIQRVLGLAFDKEGAAKSRPTTASQVDALERLVGMFASNELNTRKFPKRNSDSYAAEMSALIAKLVDGVEVPAREERSDCPTPEIVPDQSAKKYSDNGGSLERPAKGAAASSVRVERSRDSSSSAPSPAGGGRGPNSPDVLKSLHVTLEYAHAPVGLRKRLKELRSLDLTTYPIAAAILMRSVVEASIKWHFATLGSHVSGELGGVMGDVRKTYYKSHRPLQNVIDLLQDNSGTNVRPGSLRWFNMATHDANHAMDANAVRGAWQNVEHFVSFMLTAASSAPSE